jgi:hypothetical protein
MELKISVRYTDPDAPLFLIPMCVRIKCKEKKTNNVKQNKQIETQL